MNLKKTKNKDEDYAARFHVYKTQETLVHRESSPVALLDEAGQELGRKNHREI